MRVGTRHNLNPRNNADRDHPHACGDKQTGNFDMPVIQGSSPCVWGQGKLKKEAQTLGRIIPMRVGTRQGHLYPNRLSKDHPHACGDKVCENYYAGDGVGSSPCVWGQDSGDGVFTMWERIIPMRVGTSSSVP